MDNTIPQRYCYACRRDRPLSFFSNNRSKRDGKASACKDCHNKMRPQYDKRRTHPAGPSKVMRIIGFSWEDYDIAHERQQGKCAICGHTETAKNQYGIKKLALDHDHATGKFRGLLCQMCNIKLHTLEDQPFVTAATEYLHKHKSSSG